MLIHPCNKAYMYLSGQQIRSKIDSFKNTNFLISQPNPMMLPLIGIVSERVIMETGFVHSFLTVALLLPCPDLHCSGFGCSRCSFPIPLHLHWVNCLCKENENRSITSIELGKKQICNTMQN